MSSSKKLEEKKGFELAEISHGQEVVSVGGLSITSEQKRHTFLAEEDGVPMSKPALRAKYYFGLGLLFVVVLLWVGASVLTQEIFVEFDFPAPFCMTYLSTTLFTIYLFPIFWRFSRPRIEEKLAKHVSGLAHLAPRVGGQYPHPCPHWLPVMQLAGRLFPIWFVMTYTFNLSLHLTSVASNTILANTSGLFVLALSRCWLKVQIPWLHVGGVVCTILGCVVVSLRDEAAGTGISPTSGDFLSIVSALFYALFSLSLKTKVDENFDMRLMFGFIGVINMLVMWPFLIIVEILEIEEVLVPSFSTFLILVLTGLVGTVIADYLWARTVILTSPLIATLGLSLMVPFAMISDLVFNHASFSFWYLFGSLLVVTGFFLVNWTYQSKIEDQYAYGGPSPVLDELEELTTQPEPSSWYVGPKEVQSNANPKSSKIGSKPPKKTQVAPIDSLEETTLLGPSVVTENSEERRSPMHATETQITSLVSKPSADLEDDIVPQPEQNPYEVDPTLEPELDDILSRYQGVEPDSADADAELQDLLNKY